ncbi:hypothetical protein BVRB_017260, partial [Beta vulgaris subsp. vulgaris]
KNYAERPLNSWKKPGLA